jgi:hypothetical protein
MVGVGVAVEVFGKGVAGGLVFVNVGVSEGGGGVTLGVKGKVVIVGMMAVWVDAASAVMVAAPLRKTSSTERVGVGKILCKKVFPAGVPTSK